MTSSMVYCYTIHVTKALDDILAPIHTNKFRETITSQVVNHPTRCP